MLKADTPEEAAETAYAMVVTAGLALNAVRFCEAPETFPVFAAWLKAEGSRKGTLGPMPDGLEEVLSRTAQALSDLFSAAVAAIVKLEPGGSLAQALAGSNTRAQHQPKQEQSSPRSS